MSVAEDSGVSKVIYGYRDIVIEALEEVLIDVAGQIPTRHLNTICEEMEKVSEDLKEQAERAVDKAEFSLGQYCGKED